MFCTISSNKTKAHKKKQYKIFGRIRELALGKAYFERQYLSVPVMLRFNLKHGYEGSTYIGIGTDININTLSAKLRDIEDIKEKEFANKDLSFSPRIAFGGHMFGLELELFAAYDNKNPFNVDYIKTYTTQDGQYLKDICDEKSFDKQIDSDDFINKIRGGLAIRIWF